jgi:hypothetical protein
MALTRIDNPTPSAPDALADYVQILAKQTNAILQSLRNNSHTCIDFTNNFAREGVVFHVAGALYKAVTDQAISGTPSKYVKITPSGDTATIEFVASLSGVSWNDAQSGYYDGTVSNLYVFDEARAVYDGVVSSGKTIEGQIAYIAGSLSINSNLTVDGNATVSGTLDVNGALSGSPGPRLDITGAVQISAGSLSIDTAFGIDSRLIGAAFDASRTQAQLFSVIDSQLPSTVGTRKQMIGAAVLASGDILILAFASRVSATRVDLHGILYGGGVGSAFSTACNSGNGTTVGTFKALM